MKANRSAVAKKHKQHPAELTVTDIGSDEDRWFDAIITADVVDKQGERLDPHGFTLKEYRDILKAPIIDTHSNVTVGRFDPDSLEYTKVKEPHTGELVNAIKGRGRILSAKGGYEEYPIWRQVWDHIKEHAQMGKPAALSIGGDPDPEQGKKVVCKNGQCHIFVPKVFWHETSIVRDERGGANPLATVSNINAMAKGPFGFGSALLKFGITSPPAWRVVKANLRKDYYNKDEPTDKAKAWAQDAQDKLGLPGEPEWVPEVAPDEAPIRAEPPPVTAVARPPGNEPHGFPSVLTDVTDAEPKKWDEYQAANKSVRVIRKANPVARAEDQRQGKELRAKLKDPAKPWMDAEVHDVAAGRFARRQPDFPGVAKAVVPAPDGYDPDDTARDLRSTLTGEDALHTMIREGNFGPLRPEEQTPEEMGRRDAKSSGLRVVRDIRRATISPEERADREADYQSQPSPFDPQHGVAVTSPTVEGAKPWYLRKAQYDPYTGEPQKRVIRRRADLHQPQEPSAQAQPGVSSSTPPPVPREHRFERPQFQPNQPPPVPPQYRMEAPDPSRFATDVMDHMKRLRGEERERYRQEAVKRREERMAQGQPPKEEAPRIRSAPETMALAAADKAYRKLKQELDVREEQKRIADQAGEANADYLTQNGLDEDSMGALRQALDMAKAKREAAEASFRRVRLQSNEYRSKRGQDPERLRHLRGTEWEYKSNLRIIKAFDLGEGAGVHDGGPVPDDSEWLLDDTEARPPGVEPFVHEETSARKDGMTSATPGSAQMRLDDGRLTKTQVHDLVRSHLQKKKVPAPNIHEPAPPTVRKPKQEMQARQARSQAEQVRYGRQVGAREEAQEMRRAKLPEAMAEPAYLQRMEQWRKQPEATRGARPEPKGLPKVPDVGPAPVDEMQLYRTKPPPVYEPAPRSAREEGLGERARALPGESGEIQPGFEHEHAAFPQDPASRMGLAGVTGSPEEYLRIAEAEREAPAQREGDPDTRVTPPARAGLRSAAQQERDPKILQARRRSEESRVIPGEQRIQPGNESTGPPVLSPSEARRPWPVTQHRFSGEGAYPAPTQREELREAIEAPRFDPDVPEEVREPGVLHPQETPTGDRETPYRAFVSPRVRTGEGQPFRYTETESALEPRVYQPLGPPTDDPDVKNLEGQIREANLEGELSKVEAIARDAQKKYHQLLARPGANAESMQAAAAEMNQALDKTKEQFATILGAASRGRKDRQAMERYIDQRLGDLVLAGPEKGEDKMPGISNEERSLIRGVPVEVPDDVRVPERPVVLDRELNRQKHEANGFQVITIDDPRQVESFVTRLPPLESGPADRMALQSLARFIVEQGDAVQAVGNLDAAAAALASIGNDALAQRANRAAALLRLGKVGRVKTGAFALATGRLAEKNTVRREAQARAAQAKRQAALRGPTAVEETPIMRHTPMGLVPGMGLDGLLAKVGGTRFYRENMERAEPDHRIPELPGFEELQQDQQKVREWVEAQNKDLKTSLLRAKPDQVERFFLGLIEQAKDQVLQDDGLKAQFETWVSLAKDKLDEAKQMDVALRNLGPGAQAKVEAARRGATSAEPKTPKENPREMELERMKGAMQQFGLPSPWMEDQMQDWLALPTSVAHFRLLLARLKSEPADTAMFKPILDELRRKLFEKDPGYFTRMTSQDEKTVQGWAKEQAEAGEQVLGGDIQPYAADPRFETIARESQRAGVNPFAAAPTNQMDADTAAAKSLGPLWKMRVVHRAH